MIIQKNVDIKVSPANYKYYKSVIGDVKSGSIYSIDVKYLMKGSHTKIEVSCDICNTNSFKPYREYIRSYENCKIYCCSPKCAQFKNNKTNMIKYGVVNVFQYEDVKNKIIETNNVKYGVDYPSQSFYIRCKMISTLKNNYGVINPMYSDLLKERMCDTNISKYGSSSYLSSDIYSKIRIFNGSKIPDELKSEYEVYRDRVRKLTNKFKNKLFYDWDGYDFYDKTYIKTNLLLECHNKLYPTIDHKISIYYGYMNNIDIDIISNISNLCITKRSINSSKGFKNHL